MQHRLIYICLFALLGGCLITHSSDTTHNGTRVSPDTFDQIRIGSTTAGWIAATLGPPSAKTKTDPDDEVWKYVYSEHTDTRGAVFLIFGGADTTEKTETAYIEIKSGIVTNKWRG